MKTELLGQDQAQKNIVKVKVEIEPEEFGKGLDRTLRELSQQVSFRGFRRGRAPRRIIEMHFGRNAIYTETLEKMMPEHVKQITEDYDLESIDTPVLNIIGEIHEGEPVVCELTFEVMPEVELPDASDIEVERVRTVVTEDMVDRLVRQVRREFSTGRHSVDRPARGDDIVSVSFRVQVSGEEDANEADKADNKENPPEKNELDLSDETVRKDVRDALLGHSKGETVETEFDVEPNYREKRLAGKRVHYTMTLDDIIEYDLPELDEAFFKKLWGENTEILTVEAFRDKMRNDLVTSMEKEYAGDAASRALEEINRRTVIDIPEKLINRQVQALRQRDEYEAKERYKAELKDVLGASDELWEQRYMAYLKLKARDMVHRTLVVDALGKKYNVTIERPDVESEIIRLATAYRIAPDNLVSHYYKDSAAMSQLIEEIRYSKVADALLNDVKVKDVDQLTPPVFVGAGQDAQAPQEEKEEKPEENRNENENNNNENTGAPSEGQA